MAGELHFKCCLWSTYFLKGVKPIGFHLENFQPLSLWKEASAAAQDVILIINNTNWTSFILGYHSRPNIGWAADAGCPTYSLPG